MSENEREFALRGAPGLELDLVVATNGQGVVEWGGSVIGAVDGETAGRTGRCQLALDFDARPGAEASLAASVTGVACDFNPRMRRGAPARGRGRPRCGPH